MQLNKIQFISKYGLDNLSNEERGTVLKRLTIKHYKEKAKDEIMETSYEICHFNNFPIYLCLQVIIFRKELYKKLK